MMRVMKDQQPQKTMKKLFVRNLVKEDGRLTVYQIAYQLVQLIQFCMAIYASASFWHDGCQKRCAQISSNLRSELSMVILLKIEADEDCFFDQIIIGDKTWVYQWYPETKQQSKQWLPCGSSGPIKFKSERSVKKVMATVFWDSEGVVLVDF